MNILVTGGNGQLGMSLKKIHNEFPKYNFYFTDIPEMDITDVDNTNNFVAINNIDIIINCAAYTAVDKAESEAEIARNINSRGPEVLAKVTAANNIKLIHISTDYVFNGETCHPIKETDRPDPHSVYGSTKLAGEEAIRNSGCDATIIRTAWLYSEFGNNFVKTMLRLAKERDNISVVYDQVGSPTYATDLAKAIMTIITKGFSGFNIYHFTDEGAVSWYDFTKTIYSLSGINNVKVNAIESWQYPTAATRPSYSVLAKDKIKNLGAEVPYWQDSLKACLEIINKN